MRYRLLWLTLAILIPGSLQGVVEAAQDPCTVPEDERPPVTEPVTACGTTTVSGVGGGVIRLTLPTEAILDLSGSSHEFDRAEVQGSGPIVGFVLTNDWEALPTQEEKSFYAVRLGTGYYDLIRNWVGGTDTGLAREFTLPPGDYLLYLLSNGSELTVTLPFDGRPGEISVEAARTVRQEVEVLENLAPDPGGTGQWNVVSVGKSGDFGEGGFMLMSLASPGSNVLLLDNGDYCLYPFIPADESTAYWPGCPATYLENQGGGYHVPMGIGGGQLIVQEPRGERAHGYSHRTAQLGPAMRAVSVTLWYELGEGDSPT